MRKSLFILLTLTMLPLAITAQEEASVVSAQLHFGYFSRDSVLSKMPERALADRNISDLRMQYEAEMKRADEEFNKKYEEFLEGQRDFVPSILRKRQAELQDLMEKSLAFRHEAERLLNEAESEIYGALYKKINDAVKTLGKERGYAFIMNTDNATLPYVDNAVGEDITTMIIEMIAE